MIILQGFLHDVADDLLLLLDRLRPVDDRQFVFGGNRVVLFEDLRLELAYSLLE